jgi:hypothetical protein
MSKAAQRSGPGLILRGTSSYKKCKGGAKGTVKRVVVGLLLQQGKRCRFLTKHGRLGQLKSCKTAPPLYTAKGTSKWTFKVRGPLPPGNYTALVAAKDDLGNTERRTRHRNFRHFRLRAKAVLAGWHGRQPDTLPRVRQA